MGPSSLILEKATAKRPDTFNGRPMMSLGKPNLSSRKTWARKPVKEGDRQLKREGKDAEVCATALWVQLRSVRG